MAELKSVLDYESQKWSVLEVVRDQLKQTLHIELMKVAEAIVDDVVNEMMGEIDLTGTVTHHPDKLEDRIVVELLDKRRRDGR